MKLKSKSGSTKKSATIVPYTFGVNGKTYKGYISGIDESFEELINDSTNYLFENPEINSVQPAKDYQRLLDNEVGNWRIYLAIMFGLASIGSLMKND